MKISLTDAATLLINGDVVAVPTETIYGLAACFNNEEAVKKIFTIKNRPPKNPLIIHLADRAELTFFIDKTPPLFNELANAFWPGPLTLVVPIIEKTIPAIVRAGLKTAAFRIPNHPTTSQLIKKTGPLVMPSANLSGKPSSTSIEHVEHDFGLTFPVLEGAIPSHGIESTILIYKEHKWHLGRLGAITENEIERILGYKISSHMIDDNTPLCPGQLFRHYAPQALLHISQKIPENCQAIIGFSDRIYPKNKTILLLGNSNNPEEVAHQLYDVLRQLDLQQIKEAWIDMDFPSTGLWISIRERLLKASSANNLECL